MIAKGEGAIVEDVDGNRFLDFNAGIAVIATGHAIPGWSAAIQEQAEKFLHMSGTDFYYENMVELAEKLAALAPGDVPRRVYFGNSGTEAMEAAMKLARYAHRPPRLRRLLRRLPRPDHGRAVADREQERAAPGFRPAGSRERIMFLTRTATAAPTRRRRRPVPSSAPRAIEDTLIKHIVPADEIAAIFVEPVQGEGGYVVPPRMFFDELQAIAQQHGILLVCDEVQSGMGRTGKMLASEHFDLVPDMLASAKGIASGLPLSAMISRADTHDLEARRARLHLWRQPGRGGGLADHHRAARRETDRERRVMGAYLMERMAGWPNASRSSARCADWG